MKAIRLSTLATLFAAGVVFTPFASYAADDMGKMDMKMSDVAPSTEGNVKKIDKEAGKITIKHGPIANLEMPGMTMVFRVSDASMLDQVKVGDKIKFTAEKMNGALTVTRIDAAR